jgi:ubiquinone/menaquinone biosynthesis C-methylase UbiE
MRLGRKGAVLDLSSPKLLVYFLAQRYPQIDFYSIDKSEEELLSWQEITPKLNNLFLSKDDATKISFPDGYFDEVYSVSVIEHINLKKVNGDSKAMEEIYRVLKKGFTQARVVNKEKPFFVESTITKI